jgi:hypothetical protein
MVRDGKGKFYKQLKIDKKTRLLIRAYRQIKKDFEKHSFINYTEEENTKE